MDNVAFHKSKILKEFVLEGCNRILYTPPYSPDYNPIELAFSKIKNAYRTLNYRDASIMESNIHTSVQTVTKEDLGSFFRHVTTLVNKE